jgi:lipopolysaccharide transport system ATP-binding protein
MSSEPAQSSLSSEKAPAGVEMAISVRNLSKCYLIYERPEDRLKQSIVPRLQGLLGRPRTRYYREFWALHDVSLDVPKGTTLGIIGRNGSGKSTLLQIICGTLTPTAGTVEFNGRVAALLELGSGFNPEFTGRENVYMSGAVLGLSRAQIDASYEDIVAFAEIGDFMEQPVKTYSSGMYVRLAFAVIAHADADILVIDEALSVGDVFFGQKCMRFLRNFQKNGTVIFVSHDSSAVVNLCDRAILLENGRLKMSGDAKTVSEAYRASTYSTALPRNAARVSETDAKEAVEEPDAGPSALPAPRSDIEVFRFDPDRPGFGDGHARIVSAELTDTQGVALSGIVGDEIVRLAVSVIVQAALDSPIVGFFVKDRLGQTLFGDNTYLSHASSPVAIAAGEQLVAEFEFAMPFLPRGQYTVDIAVANGTQMEHTQADWIHDAIVLESHTSRVSTGLVGIPFRKIGLRVQARA